MRLHRIPENLNPHQSFNLHASSHDRFVLGSGVWRIG